MFSILDDLIKTLTSPEAPEVFISRQRCNLCPWYSSCYALAQSQQHLSLLPGVTPVRYKQLQALSLTTVESVAKTCPTELENLPGFDPQVAFKLVLQAKSVLLNRPLSLLDSSQKIVATNVRDSWADRNVHPITAENINFREYPIEIYFDIEAQPDLDLDYLFGILVVDKEAKTSQFYSLLAEKPEDEQLIWQQFLDLVWQYPQAPIYHFCVYEFDTVQRMARLYRTPQIEVEPVLNRFVDVYEQLTQSVALPVESYALKAIARWLGFKWRDPDASGARCIYWYDQWLTTGDRTLLEIIQRYNEDDCHATRIVKDWLVKFFLNGQE